MKLRYTRKAAAELQEVLAGIAEHSTQGAHRVRNAIRQAVDLLGEHPRSGRMINRHGLRRTVVVPYPYLIFYEVRNDEVVIIGVRHAARRPFSTPE